MKLFAKYNRLNLLATVIIFLSASIVFYYFIRAELIRQVDDDLQIEKTEIEAFINKHDQLPEVMPVRHLVISFQEIKKPLTDMYFQSFVANDSSEKDRDEFRSLVFGIRANGKEYQASVMKPLENTENLLWSILAIIFSTILIMLATSYIINRFVLKRLWTPFFDNLNKLKLFSLNKNEPLHFQPTKIEEFSLMNNTLEVATNKAQQDYLLLKEFTENASHEMQTPLAIIQSKLDLLIQDEQLSEAQSIVAQSVYESIQKLSRLNQSLLLLAKIGNNQFEKITSIHLKEKIENKMEAFQELWANENITVTVSLKDISVKMNTELADILLNNLLSNATKHNFYSGSIYITLNEKYLSVSNTNKGAALNDSRLYTKFYTEKKAAGNNGLGLSIVKHICDASAFNITYSYANQLHSFTISW